MDAQRLEFAQQEQSEDVIEISIGQSYTGNGRMTPTLPRMQFMRGFDLRPQVRRRTQQKPR